MTMNKKEFSKIMQYLFRAYGKPDNEQIKGSCKEGEPQISPSDNKSLINV